MSLRTIALLIVVLLPGQIRAQETSVIIRPGDVLRVTVWRDPQLSGEFEIAGDGTIKHPIYRELKVGGSTIAEAEQQFRRLLAGLTASPQFVIEPLVRVSVGGEVRSPNLYTVSPSMTIAQVVALAGGATERGRLERVRLFRQGREVLIDMKRPEATFAQMPVQSGDQIYVDRRVSIFREYIAPAGSITAALAAIAGLIVR